MGNTCDTVHEEGPPVLRPARPKPQKLGRDPRDDGSTCSGSSSGPERRPEPVAERDWAPPYERACRELETWKRRCRDAQGEAAALRERLEKVEARGERADWRRDEQIADARKKQLELEARGTAMERKVEDCGSREQTALRQKAYAERAHEMALLAHEELLRVHGRTKQQLFRLEAEKVELTRDLRAAREDLAQSDAREAAVRAYAAREEQRKLVELGQLRDEQGRTSSELKHKYEVACESEQQLAADLRHERRQRSLLAANCEALGKELAEARQELRSAQHQLEHCQRTLLARPG